jgi:hypothetical protein
LIIIYDDFQHILTKISFPYFEDYLIEGFGNSKNPSKIGAKIG